MTRIFAMAFSAFAVAATGASAGDVRRAADALGLVGVWAEADCQQPASPANTHEIWALEADGTLTQTYDIGSGMMNHYRFDQAELVGGDKVVLDGVFLGNGHHQHITLEKQDGKQRILANQDTTDGRALVNDGVISANGATTRWFTKCGR